MSPRWKKILGDVQVARGRFLMMAAALTVSIAVVAAIFTSYAILSREVPRNYLETNAASAQLEMDSVDAELIALVKTHPEIADAEASSTINRRVKVGPNEWMPLLLFVVPSFDNLRINTFQTESGAWPPATGSMLLERSALPLANTEVGKSIAVQTNNGSQRSVLIAGVVHDAGLAPAWQEKKIYGYITPQTLTAMGEDSKLHLLKIVVKENADNSKAIEATVNRLVRWLDRHGYQVHKVRIPPPKRHPHQDQLDAVISMLQLFSVLTLILGAVLAATIIGGLLAQQKRQIAIMKAVGARSSQIATLYLVLVGLMGVICAALGLPLGLLIGWSFVGAVAELLNLNIATFSVPSWIVLTVIGLAIIAPLLAALIPIITASRKTVREAIDDHGVSKVGMAFGSMDRMFARIRLSDPSLTLALRNLFRRRSRLVLTLSMLATAGAMFIASVNLKVAWEDYVAQAAAYRHYDIEIKLMQPAARKQTVDSIRMIAGVKGVEVWNSASAAEDHGDSLDVVRTYPDGGHGGWALRSAPLQTRFVDINVSEGRWLQAQDVDAIVLNNQVHSSNFPEVKVGEWISLSVNDRPNRFQVVGIVRELLTPGAAYTTESRFDQATGQPGLVNTIRIKTEDPREAETIAKYAVAVLRGQKIGVKSILTEKHYGAVQAGHIYILVFALVFIAIMMTIVGTLGLASALSSSVIERTREIGVMRAVGARSSDILKGIVSEGLFTAMLSWMIAVLLAIPISNGVGGVLASISNQPLMLKLSLGAAGLWFGIVFIAAITASIFPARQASRLTVQQTLAFN